MLRPKHTFIVIVTSHVHSIPQKHLRADSKPDVPAAVRRTEYISYIPLRPSSHSRLTQWRLR